MSPQSFASGLDAFPDSVSSPLPEKPAPYGENREAFDQLFTLAYEELRRIAACIKRTDSSRTFTPTALVAEAWVKLAHSRYIQFESALHMKRIVARAMRQILVEAARRRNSQKRGGAGDIVFVTFGDFSEPISCDKRYLALHEALDELQRHDPRQAMMIECRFFGGFEIAELKELTGLSEDTITRDLKAGRAWLAAQVRHAQTLPPATQR